MGAGRRKFSPAGLPKSLCDRFLFSFFLRVGENTIVFESRNGDMGGEADRRGENPLIYWNTGTDEDNLIIPRGNMSETEHQTLKDLTWLMHVYEYLRLCLNQGTYCDISETYTNRTAFNEKSVC